MVTVYVPWDLDTKIFEPQKMWGQRSSRVIDLLVKVLKEKVLHLHTLMFVCGTCTQRVANTTSTAVA